MVNGEPFNKCCLLWWPLWGSPEWAGWEGSVLGPGIVLDQPVRSANVSVLPLPFLRPEYLPPGHVSLGSWVPSGPFLHLLHLFSLIRLVALPCPAPPTKSKQLTRLQDLVLGTDKLSMVDSSLNKYFLSQGWKHVYQVFWSGKKPKD